MDPAEGYAAWIFDAADTWQEELRFPLLQWYVASELGADLSEVTVGRYSFDTAIYQRTQFDAVHIDAAFEEAQHVLAELIRHGWRS
jgi:hypothetical protein